MVVNADGGTAYNITAINITTQNNPAKVFDAVFDSTVGNWSEIQESEDVEHAAAVRVYDSLGNAKSSLPCYSKRMSPFRTCGHGKSQCPEPAEISGGYQGTVSFDANGVLDTFSYFQGASSFTFDPKTGAEVPMDIVLDFGTLGQADGLSQFSSTSTVITKTRTETLRVFSKMYRLTIRVRLPGFSRTVIHGFCRNCFLRHLIIRQAC